MAGFQGFSGNFFWWALILGQRSEGAAGWDGGKGGMAQKPKTSCLEQEKPAKVARRCPYHTTRPRRHLATNGSNSRSWPPNWCYKHHSFNCDITGLAKYPPEKQTSSQCTVETLFLSVAIILCNKIDFSFV